MLPSFSSIFHFFRLIQGEYIFTLFCLLANFIVLNLFISKLLAWIHTQLKDLGVIKVSRNKITCLFFNEKVTMGNWHEREEFQTVDLLAMT